MNKQQRGFTLVEIAIVLVIIGLLLGGVLKGQEMITSAKVRNLADQGSAIKTAFFAFQDRYRAVPGDYSVASTNINGVAGGAGGGNGDGNGLVNTNNDRGLFWLHLAASGFLTGNFDGQAQANNLNCPPDRCLTNSYGAPMMFSFGQFADGSNRNAHELMTGRSIPVDVLAELDRKIDDGIPRAGTFQTDQRINATTCRNGNNATSTYEIVSNNPQSDCAGVYIL
jgi:prepilin-type N-terminal cleavage/methylation domain-containing protein